jgi:hypothetical protein
VTYPRPSDISPRTVHARAAIGGVPFSLQSFASASPRGRYRQGNWLICDDAGALYAFMARAPAEAMWRELAGGAEGIA